jgi:hypothetical protein
MGEKGVPGRTQSSRKPLISKIFADNRCLTANSYPASLGKIASHTGSGAKSPEYRPEKLKARAAMSSRPAFIGA